MKLEVNHRKNFGKTKHTWRLNSMLLKNEWNNQEIKGELKKKIHGDK